MVSRRAIENVAKRIARDFDPERIILFGTHSEGRPTADSDVDLLVVLPHEGKSWRKAADIRGRINAEFPLDLLVRAPGEMRRRVAQGDPVLRQVQETGDVLYEKPHR